MFLRVFEDRYVTISMKKEGDSLEKLKKGQREERVARQVLARVLIIFLESRIFSFIL